MTDEHISWNPAALDAAFSGDLENAVVAQTPGGIEAQEQRAQDDLAQGQKLPKEGILDSRTELESE